MPILTHDLDDRTLEWAAREIEADSFFDGGGQNARRKRAREDAALRTKVRREMRAELAQHLRAFLQRDDLAQIAALRHIADAAAKGQRMDMHLVEAWPLAWRGLLTIDCTIRCNSNQLPLPTEYRIALTEAGRSALSQAEAR